MHMRMKVSVCVRVLVCMYLHMDMCVIVCVQSLLNDFHAG